MKEDVYYILGTISHGRQMKDTDMALDGGPQ